MGVGVGGTSSAIGKCSKWLGGVSNPCILGEPRLLVRKTISTKSMIFLKNFVFFSIYSF